MLWLWGYNTQGKLVQEKDPETTITQENGAQVRERSTTRYHHDLLGNVASVRDANGNLNSQILLAGSVGDQIRVTKEIYEPFLAILKGFGGLFI